MSQEFFSWIEGLQVWGLLPAKMSGISSCADPVTFLCYCLSTYMYESSSMYLDKLENLCLVLLLSSAKNEDEVFLLVC